MLLVLFIYIFIYYLALLQKFFFCVCVCRDLTGRLPCTVKGRIDERHVEAFKAQEIIRPLCFLNLCQFEDFIFLELAFGFCCTA
jgi:hypothetical protein